jgi:hypothetical protein
MKDNARLVSNIAQIKTTDKLPKNNGGRWASQGRNQLSLSN